MALLVVLSGGMGGCDDSAPPPPAGGAKLTENPSSTYGKAAGYSRDVARQIGSTSEAEAGLADEVTGQAEGLHVAGLVWPIPNTWTDMLEGNTRGMRSADYRIGNDATRDSRIVFFAFPPGQGGDVNSNIHRWSTMMEDETGGKVEPMTSTRTIAGLPVTLVEMDGTYKDNMGAPGGSTQALTGYSFRGAIVEGPRGNVFIRFTGPMAVVQQNQGAWESMVEGMRRE